MFVFACQMLFSLLSKVMKSGSTRSFEIWTVEEIHLCIRQNISLLTSSFYHLCMYIIIPTLFHTLLLLHLHNI